MSELARAKQLSGWDGAWRRMDRMVRVVILVLTMLLSTSAHAQWGQVIVSFLSVIDAVPTAIDQLVRVMVNTPIEVVSCQVRHASLKDIQASTLEIIASKTNLANRLEAFTLRPSPDRWSRVGDEVPVLLDDLNRLVQMADEKAEQFSSSRDLSDAYLALSASLGSRKVMVLEELQGMSEPTAAEVELQLSEPTEELNQEIERLRDVKDVIADELSKGC